MLIAAGGKNVPEEQIVDALWPDSEGDAGHSTFTTTISRLRQLLDNDKAVQVSGRAVTLDPRFCYVDIWAFEALVQDAERSLRNRQENVGAHSAIALKIFDLYRGSFLSEEAASSWMISCRDRLRDKLVRYVFKAGTSLEEQDCWAEAVELYRRALETDDSSEEVCQRLMSCHLRLGQQAEPVFAYKRFRQTLLKRHGIAPSDRTEALYQKALKR
jgi:DNA-binding SARP family transcriptional activator